MATKPENNPFVRWRKAHPQHSVDHDTNVAINRWLRVNDELLDLFEQYDEVIEPWLNGTSSKEPDLVAFISGYGYTRATTGNWSRLPIDIPDNELDDWEDNSGIVATMDQLREYQAGVAGCVPLMLHADLPRVIETLNRQLSAHYAELRQLAAQPTASFAPTQWPVEAIGDDVIDAEDEKLDRIFSLFEKLYCFELGIEELRVFMISEDDPEFHVPSTAFYDALVSISSHTLLATLDAAEPKLRAIVKLWSETTMEYTGQPYYRQRSDAPDSFWWRHYKPRARRPQQRRQNSSNRRPPRTSR